jgi:hypothetical protein
MSLLMASAHHQDTTNACTHEIARFPVRCPSKLRCHDKRLTMARHPTHRVRMIGKRGIQVETFHPKPFFGEFVY